MITPIRVLLVDDQALFREGIRALFATIASLELVAEAADGAEALRLIPSCRPDVVLMDLQMPGMDGVEATRHVRSTYPQLPVVALTTFDDDEMVFAALAAGARGYLVKDMAANKIVEALTEVVAGRGVLAPSVTGKVLNEFSRMSQLAPRPETQLHALTERELAVLKLIVHGASNRAIGAELGIAMGTVKNHVSSIFEKFGVNDRTQAALKARQLGIA